MKNIKSKRDGRVISKKWNKGITNNHIKSSTEIYDNDSNNDKGRKNMSWCYRRQYYKASIKDMTDRRLNNISYTMKIKSYLSRISIIKKILRPRKLQSRQQYTEKDKATRSPK